MIEVIVLCNGMIIENKKFNSIVKAHNFADYWSDNGYKVRFCPNIF